VLTGDRVELRPIREADLEAFISAHHDIRNRGAYFPLGVTSGTALRRQFAEHGFWDREEGVLLIWRENEIVGHIEFFKAVHYWDAFELSYQLYDEKHSGQGFTTEAVQLLVDYLTASKKHHRIHLVIVPDNAASCRIAEKCGFVLEGTVRGAFFNDGRNQDVLLYSLLEPIPGPGTKKLIAENECPRPFGFKADVSDVRFARCRFSWIGMSSPA
jgi:RimJ/RimL family protein N-acetyltransferase